MGEARTFTISDVLTIIGMLATCIVFGVGAAMGWFKISNKKRDDRTAGLETRMTNYEAVRAAQALQLNTLEICQANINDKLGEIKEDIANSAERGAHSVNTQLAKMLTDLQNIVSHNKRGHE